MKLNRGLEAGHVAYWERYTAFGSNLVKQRKIGLKEERKSEKQSLSNGDQIQARKGTFKVL